MGREAVRLAGNPDETSLFQRRQVARREEVRAPDPECRAQVDEARALVLRQEERTMRDPTDQETAPVGAEMSPFPHAASYIK